MAKQKIYMQNKPIKDNIKIKDENKYDHIMKKIDDFDSQFSENSENDIQTEKYFEDNLTATAFMKEVF